MAAQKSRLPRLIKCGTRSRRFPSGEGKEKRLRIFPLSSNQKKKQASKGFREAGTQ